VTKKLNPIVFNPTRCRRDLAAFQKLLQSKKELAERSDIQQFFKKRKQLSAFIGTYASNLGPAKLLGFDFPFMGDFSADIVLGNKEKGVFCVIEFEDGKANSIFTKRPKKSTTEWSRRFEHGFSQLVDWFYSLDDFKKTERLPRTSVTATSRSSVSSFSVGAPACRNPTETVLSGERKRSASIHTQLNVLPLMIFIKT
jgi:hypothetical protein